MTKNNTPVLRFAGFDGEWERKEFGSVVTRSNAASAEPALPRLEYEDIVSGVGVLNKDLNRKDSRKTGLLFGPGDVLYGKLRPYLKNWLLPDFLGIAVGDFWVLKSLTADPKFLYQLIQTPMYDTVASISSGSKMPRADWKLVSQAPMAFPSTREEQRAIGELFADLDALIEQHRAKHANLQQTKTALLQRMFPQDGADEPELRLGGFEGEWESHMIGDLMGVGSVSRVHQRDWTTAGVRFLRARDLVAFSHSRDVEDPLFISRQTFEVLKQSTGVPEKGDLLVTGVGSIGVPWLVENDHPFFFKDGNIIWFKNRNGVAGKFLYYSFQANPIQEFIKRSAGVGTVGTFTIETGRRVPFMTPPTLEEQRAIGEVFSNLDALIASESRYITKLTQAKTALLQRMFV